jgi:SAM-dependent methyltransferase
VRFSILENVVVYQLWQAPFAEKKLAPLFKRNDLAKAQSVLDVGCGPGTNTKHFVHAEYLGLDNNESYIEYARRRYRREFIVTDICTYAPCSDLRFDFILVNSVFHHIDESNTLSILSKLKNLLTPTGFLHVLDLVMPTHPSISRFLARCDRGEFARPLEKWRAIFTQDFEPVLFEPYPLTLFGVTLWNMLYFKGKPKN